MVPRWSWWTLTLSATSTSSTKASTASTSYVHHNLTWHMFKYYFSKTIWFKTVPAWYRVIKMLSDTLIDLVEVNHGEFSKYHLCPSKLIWCMFIFYFTKINRIKMVPRWSLCSRTPSATSKSSTTASIANNSYIHQKLTWHVYLLFSKVKSI